MTSRTDQSSGGRPRHHEVDVDVLIVGAGFAGLYMLHKARQLGLEARVFEAGGGVGGTWYWNRYPGARCDIESIEYSFGFDEDLQQEWEWSERYAPQAEILSYLEHVADRFGLRPFIMCDTRVAAARFDESTQRWLVTTDRGAQASGQFLVMATGCLSAANIPVIEGQDSFAGETYHTGRWPHDGVDFSGKRVGMIGTGSSAVQSIPIIARQADHLTVFQRTATYTVPAWNRALEPEEIVAAKRDYAGLRAANRLMPTGSGAMGEAPPYGALDVSDHERIRIYEERYVKGGLPFLGAFNDLLLSRDANETAAEFLRDRIRATVEDPEVAALLQPNQVVGCKRLCVDSGYHETFNRSDVELVDLRATPIEAVTTHGIRTTGGTHELDCIVYATGFDAMTGALSRIDMTGREGADLRQEWAAGPRTFLGLGVAGFPNMFTVTGPGSPSVLTNMVVAIEQHVEWIADCISYIGETGGRTIEATHHAQEQWVEYVNAVADFTLFPTCNSWYLGANVPGKTRVFMPLPGFPLYAQQCAEVAAKGYEGFVLA